MDLTLDRDVRAALEAMRGKWPEVAAKCGVSHSWISKFVRGQIPNPGFATLKALHAELVAAGAAAVTAGGADSAPDAQSKETAHAG